MSCMCCSEAESGSEQVAMETAVTPADPPAPTVAMPATLFFLPNDPRLIGEIHTSGPYVPELSTSFEIHVV